MSLNLIKKRNKFGAFAHFLNIRIQNRKFVDFKDKWKIKNIYELDQQKKIIKKKTY